MADASKTSKKIAAEPAAKPTGSLVVALVRFGLIAALAAFMLKPYLFKSEEPPKSQPFHIAGQTMGTVWNAQICADAQTLAKKDLATDPNAEIAKSCEELLQRFVQRELDAVDLAASTFKPDSDASRFNRSQSTEWIPVSATTAQIVSIALDVAAKTGGAFDPTVAPLVDLYRFGPNKSPLVSFPTDEQIAKLRERVGYKKIEVRLEPEPALRKSIPELTLDLSGVAKGFAVDRVAQALEARGLSDYLVEVGGETRCGGQKTIFNFETNALERKPWLVGIEAPEVVAAEPQIPRLCRKISFDSAARPSASLATSGDYRNYLHVGDLRFSHLIDPRSGKPTEIVEAGSNETGERLGSVSVVAETCAEADAFATALFVLGEKDGLALADKLGLSVLYLFRADDSALEIREAASQAFGTSVESEPIASADAAPREPTPAAK